MPENWSKAKTMEVISPATWPRNYVHTGPNATPQQIRFLFSYEAFASPLENVGVYPPLVDVVQTNGHEFQAQNFGHRVIIDPTIILVHI